MMEYSIGVICHSGEIRSRFRVVEMMTTISIAMFNVSIIIRFVWFIEINRHENNEIFNPYLQNMNVFYQLSLKILP